MGGPYFTHLSCMTSTDPTDSEDKIAQAPNSLPCCRRSGEKQSKGRQNKYLRGKGREVREYRAGWPRAGARAVNSGYKTGGGQNEGKDSWPKRVTKKEMTNKICHQMTKTKEENGERKVKGYVGRGLKT